MLNVDISPGGKSVKKRRGYAQAFQLTHSSMAAHGTHYFYDASGNDVALFFNDSYAYASVSGAQPVTLFSTGPVSATYQCVDSQGFAYCANTNRNTITKTNGATYSSVQTVVSTGTMLTVTPTRLVMAGFSDAPNRIDFSQANDFTNWTPGGYSYSPVNFTIVAPGSRITHIVYAHERTYWFKNTSFGYILEGPTLADWTQRTISNTVGTNDNTSVYRDGILYFRGSDSHIYAFDGSNLVMLTRDLQDTISETQSRSVNSWTQTTGTDFGAGSSTSTVVVDTSTVPGTITLSTGSVFTVALGPLAQGNYNGSCSSPYYRSQSFISTRSFFISSVDLWISKVGSPGDFKLAISSDNGSVEPGTILGSVIWPASNFGAGLTRIALGNPIALSQGTTYWIQWIPQGACTVAVTDFDWYANSGSGNKYCYGSGCITTTPRTYNVYGATYQAAGTWQSAVKNASSITAWDSFNTTYVNNDGSHDFYIRAANNSFTVNSATPNWTSISNGAIPTNSIGTYFQIRDILTRGNSGTSTPILYDFTQNWFEGNASDKPYATYHKDAVWWSVTSGTGATTNNKILRYDLINPNTWTIYDIPTNGMYVKNQSLYFVGSSTGVVYKFGDVDNDAGGAINAYWKSKDFIGVSPFQDNEYVSVSLSAAMVANSSMTVTYTVNGSSSSAYTMPLTIGNATFTKFNKYLPLGRTGTYFNLQFGNNAIDQNWEVFGAQYGFRPKPWTVTTP